MAVAYEPIRVARSVGEGAPRKVSPPEGATKTHKDGVPMVLSSGLAQEAAFGAAEIVHGVSIGPGSNLAVAGTAEELSLGAAPNMASSKIIPVGAPIKDGYSHMYAADGRTTFYIMLKDGQVFTNAMVGATFGLVKDGTSGYWFMDNTDTSGDNAVAVCRGVDPSSPNTVALGARVLFQFLAALRAF